jgi:flagellar hook-basal body complex protein FliE
MIDAAQQVSSLSFTRQLGETTAASTSRLEIGPSIATPGTGAEPGADFQATLASIGGDMVDTLRTAEEMSIAGINGKADTREVVDAVLAAEQTLRTAIAIRDKIVQSYLEISRMQI